MADVGEPPVMAPRSLFVTVLAWAIVVVSAVMIPVSVVALAMLLAGVDGTASADAFGFLSVVVAPPAAFVAGIGLLRRRSWAWYAVVVLLAFVAVANLHALMTMRPMTMTHRSEDGLLTTVAASDPNYHSLPLIALCGLILLKLLSAPVRRELGDAGVPSARPEEMYTPPPTVAVAPRAEERPPADAGRDWRVGHRGRDEMYYEERHLGGWRRIEVSGEMLMGRAHHAIYFASPEEWQRYPEWARHRRAEIIGRIKSEFRPPDYEYQGDGGDDGGLLAALAAPRRKRSTAVRRKMPGRGRTAFVIGAALFLAFSAGMGWIVKNSLERGTTLYPSKNPSLQRRVSRQDEPETFWLCVGVYSLLGAGSAGLALQGIRLAWR